MTALSEKNTQRYGTHHHQRRHTEWMEQKRHHGLIGDHTGGCPPEEELAQETDRGRDNDHRERPGQQIGEDKLRPGAAEIAECIGQERPGRCVQDPSSSIESDNPTRSQRAGRPAQESTAHGRMPWFRYRRMEVKSGVMCRWSQNSGA
jgi:hypothetical protein